MNKHQQNSYLEQVVQRAFPDSVVEKVAQIQSLWSGYGEIARYTVRPPVQHIVVKAVFPPTTVDHPRGWSGETSHKRKMASYCNEALFYQNYAHLTTQRCKVPALFDSGREQERQWLLLEDLDASGYARRITQPDTDAIHTVLRWLAHFHSLFLLQPTDDLWPIGTYWHLNTRQLELQKMPSGPLFEAAAKVDSILNRAKYQTLLHGDAKIANFCFTKDNRDVAAVDFQYTGRGCGVKDVVYFLGSCMNEQRLIEHAAQMTDYYFTCLTSSLAASGSISGASIEAEWRQLIPFAWADFERFLAGWAPEHQKRNRYSATQTQRALASLSSH